MTRRAVAWLLLVLASSPFTAPFTTCDLTTLFAHVAGIVATPGDTAVVQGASHGFSPIANDDAVLTVSSFDSTSGRAKLLTVAPFILSTPSGTDGPYTARTYVRHPMRLLDAQPVGPMSLRL